VISCLIDEAQMWFPTLCTEMTPMGAIEAGYLCQLLRVLGLFLLLIWMPLISLLGFICWPLSGSHRSGSRPLIVILSRTWILIPHWPILWLDILLREMIQWWLREGWVVGEETIWVWELRWGECGKTLIPPTWIMSPLIIIHPTSSSPTLTSSASSIHSFQQSPMI
jgi:hypothetical protein